MIYKIGYGAKGKNWDKVIIRVAFWKGQCRSTYDVQNEIIKKAQNGKYREGHVIIQ